MTLGDERKVWGQEATRRTILVKLLISRPRSWNWQLQKCKTESSLSLALVMYFFCQFYAATSSLVKTGGKRQLDSGCVESRPSLKLGLLLFWPRLTDWVTSWLHSKIKQKLSRAPKMRNLLTARDYLHSFLFTPFCLDSLTNLPPAHVSEVCKNLIGKKVQTNQGRGSCLLFPPLCNGGQ